MQTEACFLTRTLCDALEDQIGIWCKLKFLAFPSAEGWKYWQTKFIKFICIRKLVCPISYFDFCLYVKHRGKGKYLNEICWNIVCFRNISYNYCFAYKIPEGDKQIPNAEFTLCQSSLNDVTSNSAHEQMPVNHLRIATLWWCKLRSCPCLIWDTTVQLMRNNTQKVVRLRTCFSCLTAV